MPFTLAHPAAVLPLVRRPFVASALVAGAVAPDLLYVDPIYRFATQYISGNFTLTLTHEFTSALWLDPLLALLMLGIYNLVLRRPLAVLAPAALAARLPAAPAFRVLFWTVVSAILGAMTHVVWDSFTHGDGYFVRHFPGVFRAAVTPAWDVNRILQYVSTLGGCVVLSIWLYRWYRRTPPSVTPRDLVAPWLRYAVVVFGVLMAATGAIVEISRADGDLSGETAVRLALSGLVSGGLAALALYVVVWHLLRLRRPVVTL
ncbi:uncharacterized protein DUF4184 [Kribbella rubisoli]|uniref:Uncharacterized protein DUF4184 n=1 Tax=Kribbella rubisoli TaxID=3075929 RepID=A0A4Q7WRD1_9ACTN|nr:DUF4184 family protein [Kribbella rubisoli]RZU11939.1 uncharacterized protein DUF4184 [Kribbella rubisoli]